MKHGADLCTIHITSKSNLSVLTCVIDYIEIVSGPLLSFFFSSSDSWEARQARAFKTTIIH